MEKTCAIRFIIRVLEVVVWLYAYRKQNRHSAAFGIMPSDSQRARSQPAEIPFILM